MSIGQKSTKKDKDELCGCKKNAAEKKTNTDPNGG